jgi:hypothetical protein
VQKIATGKHRYIMSEYYHAASAALNTPYRLWNKPACASKFLLGMEFLQTVFKIYALINPEHGTRMLSRAHS